MSKGRKRGSKPLPKVSLLVLRGMGDEEPIIGGAYATPAAAHSAAARYPSMVRYSVLTLTVGEDQFLVPRVERFERVDGPDAAIAALTDPDDEGPTDPGPLPLEVTHG
jgi:hypothetical protein